MPARRNARMAVSCVTTEIKVALGSGTASVGITRGGPRGAGCYPAHEAVSSGAHGDRRRPSDVMRQTDTHPAWSRTCPPARNRARGGTCSHERLICGPLPLWLLVHHERDATAVG